MLHSAPKMIATVVNAITSGVYLRIADSGMAIMPIFVCHHHSGGLNGIDLLNSKIKAAITQQTMQMMTGINKSPWIPATIITNGKIVHPIAPHANCRPISERPVDVSRVAMMMAAI